MHPCCVRRLCERRRRSITRQLLPSRGCAGACTSVSLPLPAHDCCAESAAPNLPAVPYSSSPSIHCQPHESVIALSWWPPQPAGGLTARLQRRRGGSPSRTSWSGRWRCGGGADHTIVINTVRVCHQLTAPLLGTMSTQRCANPWERRPPPTQPTHPAPSCRVHAYLASDRHWVMYSPGVNHTRGFRSPPPPLGFRVSTKKSTCERL